MISLCYGDFFDFEAYSPEAIVVPVNCLGVPGAGLAKQAAVFFPRSDGVYREAAKSGEIVPGKVFLVNKEPILSRPRAIFYFPTKDDWRNPSRLEWIESGLADLWRRVLAHGIESIAIPALGCGLGGLAWEDVEPLVWGSVPNDPGLDVFVFPPQNGG